MRKLMIAGLLSCAAAAPVLAQATKPMTEAEVKAAGGVQLSGADIKQKYPGNTTYSITLKPIGGMPTGTVLAIYHRTDRARVLKAPATTIEANWWVDGNNYCAEQRVTNQGHQCYSIWDLRGTVYACLQPVGDCMFSSRLVPGNPEHL